MKKIISLVMAFALLLAGISALAETHPTPPVSHFANMKVRINDRGYTISFDKPVDRLFVNWTDTDELQELMIDEDLRAYAFKADHKYNAGVEGSFSDAHSTVIKYGRETLYEDIQINPATGKEVVRDTITYKKIQTLKANSKLGQNIAKFRKQYKNYEIEIIMPEQVFVTTTDEEGNEVEVPLLDEKGHYVYTDGEMRAYSTTKTQYWATNVATRAQAAFITLQDDEWVVYYNRSGQIIDIEYYENQF